MPFTTNNQRYQIITLLGKGGMAEVFLVDDLKLHKTWAMKRTAKNSQKEIIASFYKEVKILSSIHHVSIPGIIDQFEDDTYVYYVMDYFTGNNLSKQMNEQVQTFDEVLSYMSQVCNIFIYLHTLRQNAILYLDLKPENIIIDDCGVVRLVDFGTSAFFNELTSVSCATPRIRC